MRPEIRTYLTQAQYDRLFGMIERERAMLETYDDEGFKVKRLLATLKELNKRLSATCMDDEGPC